MKAAVRYYSRGGHIKALAEAFARGAGVEAVSIDDPNAPIDEPIDVLFIGGALYKYRLADELVSYLESLPEGLIGRAVCFGSSMLTRRPVYLIQEQLKKHGIAIVPQAVYARNRPKQSLLDACEFFAAREIERDTSTDGMSPYERFRAMRIATGDVSLDEAHEDMAQRDSDLKDDPSDAFPELTDSSSVDSEESLNEQSNADEDSAVAVEDDPSWLLINVDGVNAAFKDQTIEIVEGIPEVDFKLVTIPGTPATSLVFSCDAHNDIDEMVPLIKGTLKKSELGGIMLFRVTPHGELMWQPKRK